MFHHIFKAEFATLISLKVPSGREMKIYEHIPML